MKNMLLVLRSQVSLSTWWRNRFRKPCTAVWPIVTMLHAVWAPLRVGRMFPAHTPATRYYTRQIQLLDDSERCALCVWESVCVSAWPATKLPYIALARTATANIRRGACTAQTLWFANPQEMRKKCIGESFPVVNAFCSCGRKKGW